MLSVFVMNKDVKKFQSYKTTNRERNKVKLWKQKDAVTRLCLKRANLF